MPRRPHGVLDNTEWYEQLAPSHYAAVPGVERTPSARGTCQPALTSASQSSNPLHHHATPNYTRPFNGPLSGTTRVSQYQKGKTNLDFTEARDSEWQWHQPGRMQA